MTTMFRRKRNSIINSGQVDVLCVIRWGAAVVAVAFVLGVITGFVGAR